MYGIDDFVRVLVQTSKEKQFTASDTAALAQMNIIKSEESKIKAKLAGRKDGKTGEERQATVDDDARLRTPTAKWVLDIARSMDSRRMLAWSRGITRRMAKVGKRLGIVGSTSTVAIDITDIEYYGKGMVGRTRKSKPKNDISSFVSYMVAHSVGSDYGIPIDSRPVKRKGNVAKLTRRMLKSIEVGGPWPHILPHSQHTLHYYMRQLIKGKHTIIPLLAGSASQYRKSRAHRCTITAYRFMVPHGITIAGR